MSDQDGLVLRAVSLPTCPLTVSKTWAKGGRKLKWLPVTQPRGRTGDPPCIWTKSNWRNGAFSFPFSPSVFLELSGETCKAWTSMVMGTAKCVLTKQNEMLFNLRTPKDDFLTAAYSRLKKKMGKVTRWQISGSNSNKIGVSFVFEITLELSGANITHEGIIIRCSFFDLWIWLPGGAFS